MVMERLAQLNEVAYVRFASVYRRFKDIAGFEKELLQIKEGKVAMVINTPTDAHSQADSFLIRRCALDYQVPYFTTIAGAEAAAEGIEYLKEREFDVKALQDYAAASLD